MQRAYPERNGKTDREVKTMQQVIRKNHMDIAWHEYTDEGGADKPVTEASLTEKASIIGRVGIMFLSCGTGAWRVRNSMNTLAEIMGITCTADIGLMSIEYTCFDGENGFTQSLCLTNTGVNTSKLNRLEHFIREFESEGKDMSGEELHSLLDDIERIHGLYSPVTLGLAAALACCGFTFLLGGGPIEMFCAFVGAGFGNFLRCKLTKHHFTLFLCIVSSVSLACLVYAGFLKIGEVLFGISIQHEAGYICAMLFIIPGFPFITSGIDLAKLDMRSGTENVPGIAGIGLAAKTIYTDLDEKVAHMRALKQHFIEGVQKIDHTVIHGLYDETSAPHIISVGFAGIRSEVLLHTLEEKGIYVSSGSACASNHPAISGVLKGIGAGKEYLDATLRFSMSEFTTEEEIDYTLETLYNCVPMLRKYTRL